MPASVTAKISGLLVLVLMLSFMSSTQAITFEVSAANITKIGNGHVLDASIRYPLTPRVIEALDNGIPIVFFQEFKLVDVTPLLAGYWEWEDTLWDTKISYELRYHALAQQYVLQDTATGKERFFPSLEGTLHALGTIQNLTLPPKHMTDNKQLVFELRSGIDLYQLPTPMRPGAIVSSKWHLTSPWTPAQWH
ncbi:hypothetical protein LCGC14_0837300 [marine sediment metagenome]|uniref:DUF4390 domain-containing protein n=1 Tax=marine sediment metagenome TaxID=412755 RepID=A0A0F9PZE4_9ZZZZ